MPRQLPWRPLLLPAIAASSALGAGYLIARQASAPGDMQGLVYFWCIPIGMVALLGITAGTLGRTHDEDPNGAPTQAMASGAALGLGLVLGLVLTPVLGLTYPPVTYLSAVGTSNLQLVSSADFQPDPTAATQCRSLGDATAAGQVVVETAGIFRGEHVIATLARSVDGTLTAITIELDGTSDIPVAWTGNATVVTGDADGRSGRATFDGLVGTNIAVRGLPAGQASGSLGDWPMRISGTLTWSCGSWSRNPA
jgi:hypothetical protein